MYLYMVPLPRPTFWYVFAKTTLIIAVNCFFYMKTKKTSMFTLTLVFQYVSCKENIHFHNVVGLAVCFLCKEYLHINA